MDVTHLAFSARPGKCISSTAKQRPRGDMQLFPLAVAHDMERFRDLERLTAHSHPCIFFKRNRTVENCCAALCPFYWLPKKGSRIWSDMQEKPSALQTSHIIFIFSYPLELTREFFSIQEITFFKKLPTYVWILQILIDLELYGSISWYLYVFSFINETVWPGSLSGNTWWSHFLLAHSRSS